MYGYNRTRILYAFGIVATEEQIPVYSLIMKFEKTQLYDNIWR